MSEVQSFHFELDATVTTTAEGFDTEIPIVLVGDFQAPDRSRGTLIVTLGFFALEMETITIDETTYTTNPQTDEWELVPKPSFALTNPMIFTGLATPASSSATLIGLERLEGSIVYHLHRAGPEDLFGESDTESEVGYWISVDNSLIQRIEAKGEISLEALGSPLGISSLMGKGRIEMSLRLSDFGKPVTIEAP